MEDLKQNEAARIEYYPLTYEHLICEAFKCPRAGIWFANADTFRGGQNMEQRDRDLRIYVTAALKVLITYRRDDYRNNLPILEELYNRLDHNEITADDAIERLYETCCF